MLRCPPSEITLTPADVDETRRRLANRQAAGRTARKLPGLRPNIPRIHRGAEQSRYTAVTRLGVIPILRPHSAVHSSADEDPDEDAPRKSAPVEGELMSASNLAGTASQEEHHIPTSSAQELVGLDHTRVAALRIASSSVTEDEAQHDFTGFDELGNRRTSAPNTMNEGQALAVQSSGDATADVTDPLADTHGRGPSVGRVLSLRASGDHASLQQLQVASPLTSRSSRNSRPSTAEEELPILLEGYWTPDQYTFREVRQPRDAPSRRNTTRAGTASSNDDASVQDWHVPAHFPNARIPVTGGDDADPSSIWETLNLGHSTYFDTTPRQPPWRSQAALETLNLGSLSLEESSYQQSEGDRLQQHEPDASERCPVTNIQRIQGSSQRSSHSSLPYSIYELPSSRQPSSIYSQSEDPLPQAQYDGSTASRQVNKGAYFSIRPSGARPTCINSLRPPPRRISSYSSPNLTADLGQHRFSPRPSTPYSRARSTQNSPRPSVGLVSTNDFATVNNLSVVEAIERNITSPLELIQRRAASHTYRLPSAASHHTASSQTASGSLHPSSFRQRLSDYSRRDHGSYQHQGETGINAAQYASHFNHRGLTTDGDRYPVFPQTQDEARRPSGPLYARPTTDRQIRHDLEAGQFDDLDLSPILPPPRRDAQDHHFSQRWLSPQRPRRNRAQGASTQRSSNENDPVGPSSDPWSSPPARRRSRTNTIVRGDPVTITPSLPPTQNIQQVTNRSPRILIQPHSSPAVARVDTSIASSSPIDRSNRPHLSSPRQRDLTRVHPSPPVRPPRPDDFFLDGAYDIFPTPRRIEGRHGHHHRQAQYPTFDITSLEQDVSEQRLRSRRLPGPGIMSAPPRRRPVPLAQANQENSGEAEDQMMREELERRALRGGASEGLNEAVGEVMDETPPRLGRFERLLGL